jgi:hypothetical protein
MFPAKLMKSKPPEIPDPSLSSSGNRAAGDKFL